MIISAAAASWVAVWGGYWGRCGDWNVRHQWRWVIGLVQRAYPWQHRDCVDVKESVSLYMHMIENRDEVVQKIYKVLLEVSRPLLFFVSFKAWWLRTYKAAYALWYIYYVFVVQNGTKAGLPFRVYLREDLPLRLHAGHFNKQWVVWPSPSPSMWLMPSTGLEHDHCCGHLKVCIYNPWQRSFVISQYFLLCCWQLHGGFTTLAKILFYSCKAAWAWWSNSGSVLNWVLGVAWELSWQWSYRHCIIPNLW